MKIVQEPVGGCPLFGTTVKVVGEEGAPEIPEDELVCPVEDGDGEDGTTKLGTGSLRIDRHRDQFRNTKR